MFSRLVKRSFGRVEGSQSLAVEEGLGGFEVARFGSLFSSDIAIIDYIEAVELVENNLNIEVRNATHVAMPS
jgi:hypothetical protein